MKELFKDPIVPFTFCILILLFISILIINAYESQADSQGVYPGPQLEAKKTAESLYLYQDARTTLKGDLQGYLSDFSLDAENKRISTIHHNYIVQEFTNEETFLSNTSPGDVVLVTFTNPTN